MWLNIQNVFFNIRFLVSDHNIFRESKSVEGENYKAGVCKSTVLSLEYLASSLFIMFSTIPLMSFEYMTPLVKLREL